ncbi:MAG TPA: glycosyltransferase [Acetobacteraceae bacterium]|nr:glycosyltransferase [Acetobacteraceae bacterium]
MALGDRAAAQQAVSRALSRFAFTPTVAAVARAAGLATWCGLTADGRLVLEAPEPAIVRLDGTAVVPGEGGCLPTGWEACATLSITVRGQHLAGSPIDLAARRRVEGFVALTQDGIEGWAWHPAVPEANPTLRILRNRRTTRITATDLSVPVSGATALARPRGFRLRCDTSTPTRVVGADGRDVLGSPLGGPAPAPAAVAPTGQSGTAIIIPIYRGLAETLACVNTVRATKARDDEIILVNDASPEPALVSALQDLAATGAVTLLNACPDDPDRNVGFPAAANTGLAAAAGRDAVLLNSDTLVFPGWLAALRAAAHSAPDIGTATPLSNDATIFTYPDPVEPSPMPGETEGAEIARAAARANRGVTVDVPTGHGFCLYIRADCLHRTGLLRAGLFAQGYGEENDFCERAAAVGFRHVAAPGVYVAHKGGVSFGAAKEYLLRRNARVLQRLHPTYAGRIDDFIAADPLAPSRARIDTARLTIRPGGSVLLITHGGLGGTTRVVRARAEAVRAAGRTPITLNGEDGVTLVGDTPNLRFRLPADGAALLRLLRRLRPLEIEFHHLMGHHPALADLLGKLGVPTACWVHDYGWLCPRLALVTGDAKFCGEPPATHCAPCVARWGQSFEPPVDAVSLRDRSATILRAAQRVMVASTDVATRIRRHFPGAPIQISPLEPDPPPAPPPPPRATPLHVAVIGAIGMEKGYDMLLACGRDAAARDLPLRFTLVGYSIDDSPLLETGRIFVTGPFKAGEAESLIRGTGAALAFIPSIWPETWCFALSDAWAAGLPAIVFDIGTPAERVRRTGRGAVLPLGLPPPAVNDALLNPQSLACRSGA